MVTPPPQVRQWPGNVSDIIFRDVIDRCKGVVVAAPPVPGSTVCESFMAKEREHAAFLESEEYASLAKVMTFCRLWCVVEVFAAMERGMHPIYRGVRVSEVSGDVVIISSEGALNMLDNFALMVLVEKCQVAVPADKIRELGAIGEENLPRLNKEVRSSLGAGASAVNQAVSEVDAYACRETEALRSLSGDRAMQAFIAAASAGQLEAMFELAALQLNLTDFSSLEWNPLVLASANGHVETVKALASGGAEVNQTNPNNGVTPLFMASQENHLEVVRELLEQGAEVDKCDSRGQSPLIIASRKGNLEVARVLLQHGADVQRQSQFGTALMDAEAKGHSRVAALLREHGA